MDFLGSLRSTVLLVYFAPIHTQFQTFLENQIKPDAGRTAIAFHERMSSIHLHIFIDNLVESCLRHLLHSFKIAMQMLRQTEQGIAFGNCLGAYLACKVVEATEKIGVDLL